jgi:hypothetical protein
MIYAPLLLKTTLHCIAFPVPNNHVQAAVLLDSKDLHGIAGSDSYHSWRNCHCDDRYNGNRYSRDIVVAVHNSLT